MTTRNVSQITIKDKTGVFNKVDLTSYAKNDDASLTKKGITMLQTNIDNTETKAATPKAVKTVHDKFNTLFSKGKVEFVDDMPAEPEANTMYLVNTDNPHMNGAVKDLPDATETTKGLVQFATKEEVLAGTINNKAVVPKYLPNRLQPITQAMIIYVSASGNNSSADGTEAKPFQTIATAYNYLKNNFYFIKGTATIKVISDLTEEPFDYTNILGANKYTNLFVTIDGTGHNVVLKSIAVRDAMVYFKHITFTQGDNNQTIIDCVCFSRLYLNDCTFKLNKSQEQNATGGYIVARYYSFIDFFGTNYISCEGTIKGKNLFSLYAFSRLNFLGTSLDIQSELTLSGSFFNVMQQSGVYFISTLAISNPEKLLGGKKYTLTNLSLLQSSGRGDSIIPGTAGTIDDSSVFN